MVLQWSFLIKYHWFLIIRYDSYSSKAFYHLRENFKYDFQRFQKDESPISTLRLWFLHKWFSNFKIICNWCIIDVFQWNSPWTLDFHKSLDLTKIWVMWSCFDINEFKCRLLWAFDSCINYDCLGYRLINWVLYILTPIEY